MSLSGLLKTACTVERPAATIASDGRVTRSFSVVASNVPCALHRLETEETRTVAGRHETVTARLYVERGADIRPVVTGGGDRVTVHGVIYQVIACEESLAADSCVLSFLVRREG